MESLGLDIGLLLSQIINFGLMVLILYTFLYKRILGKLEERAARIKKGMADADRAEQILAEAQKRYEEEMERARREALAILERATLGAEQQRQEILAQARQEAHELVIRAQQQAQLELQEGRVTLGQQVIDLAIAAASRVLEENLDDEKHHQLVRQFLDDTGRLA